MIAPKFNQGPVPRFELEREEFPVKIEAFHPETKKVVWSTVIETPETKIYIPPLAKLFGHPVSIRTKFATGRIIEKDPNGQSIETQIDHEQS